MGFSNRYLEDIKRVDSMDITGMEKMLFHTIFSVQEFSRDLRSNIPLMDMTFDEVVTSVEAGKTMNND